MSSPAIQSALQQMQQLASQASQQPLQGSQVSTAVGQGSFGSELQASIQRINRLQQTANSQAVAFQSGESDLALNEVMADMQKASVAFQMGMQVRNRLVTAYKDVMNMQV
ncbi:flagellar hook-basal body complex protein FliE [Vreelandella massiliensis]|uniref:flagellar hook-basal body complex protein FliE n=1 Tax=Vreelandella massiliensis TaxID=1816686 RepID=UPI00096ABF26|nr:flagellar hook-basal body complex protein FliE [Halomonas massiliensis]MYL24638.1 flagellar hook-basal body complex protein FliE [Halomonas alkaliantarctica]